MTDAYKSFDQTLQQKNNDLEKYRLMNEQNEKKILDLGYSPSPLLYSPASTERLARSKK